MSRDYQSPTRQDVAEREFGLFFGTEPYQPSGACARDVQATEAPYRKPVERVVLGKIIIDTRTGEARLESQ